LLENGTDFGCIQEILGHNSSKTSEIYTYVITKSIQKIVSPFDFLKKILNLQKEIIRTRVSPIHPKMGVYGYKKYLYK
jgi:hypothetical protein